MFRAGFWKHTQNKDLSYINTFHPRYWIFLVSLSEFMALGLLFSGSSRTPSASLFPFENVITITQAAALKLVPALQIRRSQPTFTWGQAAWAELLCSARASWLLARTGISIGLWHWSLFAILKGLVRRNKGLWISPILLYFIFSSSYFGKAVSWKADFLRLRTTMPE